MGEVYKARDTRLGRTVAIKVLNAALAADARFRARFAIEARTLSQIAHPNICVLHDVGDEGSTAYLVLEYLEGETLTDRIARGPVPFDEARRIGVDICRALHSAHRSGVIHRDLKPGNVMLTRSGAKLMDFGLAREEAHSPSGNTSTAVALTEAGTIVGTAPYMSPEQLRGLPADTRSDIFALGAVLYEMFTGRRVFDGSSPLAIAAAILAGSPPAASAANRGLPLALDAIVAGCLAADPDARWQSAHDVGKQLENLPAAAPAGSNAGTWRTSMRSWWPLAVAAIAIIVAIGAWTFSRRAAPPEPATNAFQVPMPAGTAQLSSVEGNSLALSPDGLQLAWVGVDADGSTRIWLRPLAKLESHAVAGTDGASALFWSPDSRSIAFFANGLLQRLDLPATAPLVVCALRSPGSELGGAAGGIGYTGTWGADGQMLFAPIQGEAIYRVSASGGTPDRMVAANRAAGERRVGWPWFLADGRTIIYKLRLDGGESWLMLSRPGQPPQRITRLVSEVQGTDGGYLVFGRDGALVAERLDVTSGQLTGDPISLATGVETYATGWGRFSASRSGTVAFGSGNDEAQITWIDRDGAPIGRLGNPGNYLDIIAGADPATVLVSRLDAAAMWDIWSIDLARGVETRVTSGPFTKISPLITPDRRWMIYSKAGGGSPELYRRDLTGGAEERLAPREAFQLPTDITRDGRTLVYSERTDRGDWDVLALPLAGARTPAPLAATPFNEMNGQLSPDDHLLAFASNETNRLEVYVAPFPAAAPKYRVSTGGGRNPRWSPNGRDLLYLGGDGRLMSAAVSFDGGIRIGAPVAVSTQAPRVPWRDFLPLPDGRLLAIVPEMIGREQPMTVITHAIPPALR